LKLLPLLLLLGMLPLANGLLKPPALLLLDLLAGVCGPATA
jgi:hypothetical protein